MIEMKKIIMILTITALVLLTASPVFAQAENLLLRVAKAALSPIVGSIEMIVTIERDIFTGENGPIVSVSKGVVNCLGRVFGDFANIFSENAYEVEYFEDNPLAKQLNTSPSIDFVDWVATGAIIGVIGVNNNVWGGAAKSWTRFKAGLIGITSGAVASDTIKAINIQ